MILKTAANMQEHGYIETGKEGGYYEVDGQRTEIGGGGGSSDFSTAEVTLTNPPSSADALVFNESVIISDNKLYTSGGFSDDIPSYIFVLYKGKGTAVFPNKENLTVTGNIEYNQEFGVMIIRGDGTITIEDGSGN